MYLASLKIITIYVLSYLLLKRTLNSKHGKHNTYDYYERMWFLHFFQMFQYEYISLFFSVIMVYNINRG